MLRNVDETHRFRSHVSVKRVLSTYRRNRVWMPNGPAAFEHGSMRIVAIAARDNRIIVHCPIPRAEGDESIGRTDKERDERR